MAQKKQTEAKEASAPVKEQAPAKSKSGNAATKKTAAATPVAADAVTKPEATTAKASSAKAKPAATKAAPANTAPAKKAADPKVATSAAKKAATGTSASLTKVYGEIQASENKYFIQKGSVADGQLELIPQKDKQDLKNRIPSYNGQFVTVLGEFAAKKKTDKSASFTIHSIASHDEIARRAHELSHDNPAAVEDNWFRAENQLLQ